MGVKRTIERVDLTQSDDEGQRPGLSKTPRTSSSGQRFGEETSFLPLSQSSQAYVVDDEDDAQAVDVIPGSQEANDDTPGSTMLFGNLHTKIVGIRYYRGHATIGEHVILKREPSNQYDANAIRVDNVMGAQIGHIPRNMAAKLAKYLVYFCAGPHNSFHLLS